jgi:hypothetical protein
LILGSGSPIFGEGSSESGVEITFVLPRDFAFGFGFAFDLDLPTVIATSFLGSLFLVMIDDLPGIYLLCEMRTDRVTACLMLDDGNYLVDGVQLCS